MLRKKQLELIKIADSVIGKGLDFGCIIQNVNSKEFFIITQYWGADGFYVKSLNKIQDNKNKNEVFIEDLLFSDLSINFLKRKNLGHFPTSKQLMALVFQNSDYNSFLFYGSFMRNNPFGMNEFSQYKLPQGEPITWTDEQIDKFITFLKTENGGTM